MSNLTSNLKSWGSTGSAWPNGYAYAAGEQPVDQWDNYFNDNVVKEIQSLQSVVNDRIESDAGTAQPSAPETPHLFFDTDAANDAFEVYTGSTWRRLLYADGDAMSGQLDMAGNAITDSSAGSLTLSDDTTITGAATINGSATIDGAGLDAAWADKFEGGSIPASDFVPLRTFELADGETLYVTQAHLTQDGYTTAAASGINLIITPDGSTNVTVLSGDGATLYADEVGAPVASYTNTTGAPQVVAVAIENTTTASKKGYGGFVCRVA